MAGEKCCCCKLKKGVAFVFSLDTIFTFLFGINFFVGLSDRDDYSRFADAIAENMADNYDDWEVIAKVPENLEKSIDTVVAVGAIMFFLVYIPRMITYIVMRARKHNHSLRKVHYGVRVTTLIIELIVLIAGIIALIIYTIEVLGIIVPYTIAPIAGWVIAFVFFIIADSIFCCIMKRYADKSHNKGHKTPHMPVN